jgi:hypothetical protein
MMSTPSVFGRRWWLRIRYQRAPTAGPALMYSFCFSVVTWPLTIRAVVSQLAIVSAATIVQNVTSPLGLRI